MDRCSVTSLVVAGALALSPIAVGLTQPAQAATPVATAAAPSSAAPAAPRGEAPQDVRHLTFTTQLRSVDSIIRTLPGGVTYGRNHLRGRTTWNNRHANIDFLAIVEYVNGSGPFYGVVTVTRADGSSIVFSANGRSISAGVGTTDARFTGQATVLGGSGAFAGATGTGTMTGFRKAALGGQVRMTFRLTVTR
jgi:hypothetical protein